MKLIGIPYLGENNYNKIKYIINKDIDYYKDISMYKLFSSINNKNELIIVDNKYITWIEDTQFNYLTKHASIVYYSYEWVKYMLKRHKSSIPKYYNHLEIIDDNYIKLRYNFKLEYIDLDIGSKLLVYSIDTDRITEYTLTSYIDEDFYIDKLYKLYRDYCFYDANLDFGEHEGGYTYISKHTQGFNNKEHRLRVENFLETYINSNELVNYNDVRIYNYFEYIEKVGDYDISTKLFKYRKLAFEVYLYCCLMSGKVPLDCDNWDSLGKTKQYIKITDGIIPLFIKHEWLTETHIKSHKTWRHKINTV